MFIDIQQIIAGGKIFSKTDSAGTVGVMWSFFRFHWRQCHIERCLFGYRWWNQGNYIFRLSKIRIKKQKRKFCSSNCDYYEHFMNVVCFFSHLKYWQCLFSQSSFLINKIFLFFGKSFHSPNFVHVLPNSLRRIHTFFIKDGFIVCSPL